MSVDPVIALTLRGAGAALFAWAALHKLRGFAYFRVALADYRLVPWWASGLAARSIVAAELATAALLVSPLARPSGFAAAAGLLALYTVAIGLNLLRGRREIDCGCFGPAHRAPLGGALLGRNAALGALALAGLAPVAARPLVPLDALTAGGGLILLALLYASANRLIESAPHLRALRGES